jgi:uncharacterized protein YbjT (DUF2867 family)
MRVAIAGAHGKVAMRLIPLLTARGHSVVGLIRNPDHAQDLSAAGAEAAVCDLEHAPVSEVAEAVSGADVVVFAAGAGAGSGAQRKLTMDRDGAIKLLQASEDDRARYVMLSSVGAENPPSQDEDDVFGVYLRAKAEADQAVMASDREWTILRPGALTDEAGSGRVRIDREPYRGQIPRDDVAGVLAVVIADNPVAQQVLYVNSGDLPIDQALSGAASR